ISPIRDIEIIESELILADMQTLEKRIESLTKRAKGNDKEAKELLEVAKELLVHLENSQPASTFKDKSEAYYKLLKELRLLSAKEIIYGANVDEDSLAEDNKYVKELKEYAKKFNREVIKLSAKLEEELIDFSEEEKKEMLASLGVKESGLEQIIKKGFDKLGLMSYFTAGVKEVRAWTIKKGTKAPDAAAVIHNDFKKGFIRAEVISYEDFIKYNGEAGAKEAGKMRLEGKDYIVQDGDIIHFRFNV
ncbi:MAG: redox-regulated ATPase YchF, partial [Epsilonproteobacteria bacterium]|nr:redox-regulated ATPase YchF [Campylobacterota bacterium]